MKRTAAIAFVLFFAAAPAAYASHYDLIDIDLVPAAVTEQLAAEKIDTTEHLLARLMTKKDRAEFSKKYAVPAAEVDMLARKLELMQIIGIGPKAAQLLILADIKNVTDLAAAKPDPLLDALLRVNRIHSITGVQPDMTVVRDWIKKAKDITNHIEL